MKQSDWRKKIVEACENAGTYKSYFDSVIDTLSQILETRDITYKQWIDEGSEPVIIHTNKAGEPNPTKNPLLTMVNDLNTQALAYWRELGLTVKAWHSFKEEEDNRAVDGLEKILEKLNVK